MFKKSTAYGDTLNSYDICKLVALAAMIIDHLGSYFWHDAEWLRVAGRLAFPLFLFLVGYSGKWTAKPDLLILAAMITICAVLTHHTLFPLNILVTIALTRVAMRLLMREEMEAYYLRRIFVASVVWFPLFLWCDYSTAALLFAVCGYLQRQDPASSRTRMFLYATTALYCVFEWWCFEFKPIIMIILAFETMFLTWVMAGFTIREFSREISYGMRIPLRWIARNTLPIYAFHVMIFMCVERLYFPERLAHFQWI